MNKRRAKALALDMASSLITSALGAGWEVESGIAARLGIEPEAVSEQDARRVVAALNAIAQRLADQADGLERSDGHGDRAFDALEKGPTDG